jgi:hypothetical protein
MGKIIVRRAGFAGLPRSAVKPFGFARTLPQSPLFSPPCFKEANSLIAERPVPVVRSASTRQNRPPAEGPVETMDIASHFKIPSRIPQPRNALAFIEA